MKRKEFLLTLAGAGAMIGVANQRSKWRYWVGVEENDIYITLNPGMSEVGYADRVKQQAGGEELAKFSRHIPSIIAKNYPIPRWPMVKRIAEGESSILHVRDMPESLKTLLEKVTI